MVASSVMTYGLVYIDYNKLLEEDRNGQNRKNYHYIISSKIIVRFN